MNEVIQMEWALITEVFQVICQNWHTPQLDLFATRFNKKLPQFVSPVLDLPAWAVDSLSLSWEKLNLVQNQGQSLQEDNNHNSMVAPDALVLGPGRNVSPSTTVSATTTQPTDTAVQSGSS